MFYGLFAAPYQSYLSSLICCRWGGGHGFSRYPEADLSDEQARTYLGQFGISNMLALEPLYILSGGQKSRVAIALMAYNNPHILVSEHTRSGRRSTPL